MACGRIDGQGGDAAVDALSECAPRGTVVPCYVVDLGAVDRSEVAAGVNGTVTSHGEGEDDAVEVTRERLPAAAGPAHHGAAVVPQQGPPTDVQVARRWIDRNRIHRAIKAESLIGRCEAGVPVAVRLGERGDRQQGE